MEEITTQETLISGLKQQENQSITKDIQVKDSEQIAVRDKELKQRGFQPGISGNPKGRPKGTFSIRQDLIKSLKQIKRTNSKLYQEIISSYWQDTKLRPFLLEIIDGKARQQVDFGGNMSNPIRIIEVRANIEPNEAK